MESPSDIVGGYTFCLDKRENEVEVSNMAIGVTGTLPVKLILGGQVDELGAQLEWTTYPV